MTTIVLGGGLIEASDPDRCVEIEPALTPVKDWIGGGFFSPEETAGDAFLFTQRLAAHCADLGVRFEYSTSQTALEAPPESDGRDCRGRGSFSGRPNRQSRARIAIQSSSRGHKNRPRGTETQQQRRRS